MHWSDHKPLAIGAYGLAAVLALFEIVVLWQALHPQVSEPYRAYYIDRTTTCLPQPVSGAYELGQVIDFRSGAPDTRELRPCGWEGPAGDGMHAVGESAQLRLAIGAAQDMTLMLELTAVSLPGPDEQIVLISVNGTSIGEARLKGDETKRLTFPVPAAALSNQQYADIILDFPRAILVRPGDSNTRKRSIKLVSAALGPAVR